MSVRLIIGLSYTKEFDPFRMFFIVTKLVPIKQQGFDALAGRRI
jgi:hypothetical protein